MVSCKAVAMQNSSEWPCSMRPFPQLRLVGVRTSYIYFFLIFPGHLELWTPLQIPIWGPSLGCTLLQYSGQSDFQQIIMISTMSYAITDYKKCSEGMKYNPM